MSSIKKILANRDNARKSTGPNDTSSTRLNAKRHGMLGGITALDDVQYRDELLADMIQRKKPVGMLETALLEHAAHNIVCWKRGERLESEFITGVLNPTVHEKNFAANFDFELNGAVIDPGIPASIGVGIVQEMDRTFQRYQTSAANRAFRALHEFEREQRMRAGETLPAPIAVDVSLSAATMQDVSTVRSALHDDVEGCERGAEPPSGSAQKETLSTKSEEPEAAVCESANSQGAIRTDVDVLACSAVEYAPGDAKEGKISPPDQGTFARPVLNADRAGSGEVKKAAEPWRPPVKTGPLWNI